MIRFKGFKFKSGSTSQRIAVGVVCVAVLSYTVFHMVSLFSAELSTIVVRSTTDETSVELDGYIFRDESVVYSEYGGAVDYIAHDGLKLATGESMAIVYEQGNNANISDSIDQIDKRIAVLEQSVAKGTSLSDLPSINSSLGETYQDIMKKLAEGDVRGIAQNIDAMTASLGKVSVLTNDASPIPDTLNALYAERARLMAAGGSSQEIRAEKSGYFYSDVDGYEGVFTLDAADKLTPDNYYSYASAPAGASPEGQHPVGKMVYDSEWKFVALVSRSTASYFEKDVTYRVKFMSGAEYVLPLTLERAERSGDNTLLVFSCDRIPAGFDFDRAQSAEIVVRSVTGISVPKSAVHKKDGALYVYILKGSVVFERRIDIVYEGSDYYTVRDGVPSDDSDVYLQSNDTLILNGQNLFDGRILE
ncbi:MAG: hypothetical protein J6Q77_00405 [Clostridia bacterium]|nr:hypothetical protein [Clostridia bacterium]